MLLPNQPPPVEPGPDHSQGSWDVPSHREPFNFTSQATQTCNQAACKQSDAFTLGGLTQVKSSDAARSAVAQRCGLASGCRNREG